MWQHPQLTQLELDVAKYAGKKLSGVVIIKHRLKANIFYFSLLLHEIAPTVYYNHTHNTILN